MAAAEPSQRRGQALRVLVVDSQLSRKATVSLLESCDYTVVAVSTAKEAFAVLKDEPTPPFDLLLKDHDPAAGVNACRMLAKLKNTAWANLPVVVCSDHDSRAEVLKCVNLGAADYLVKPLRRNELLNLWTRVPSLRWAALGNFFAEDGAKIEVADAAETARVGPAQGSPSGSDGTARREEDENPTSKEGSAPGLNGGNSSLQHAKGAHGSNGNGNGSNGNGASATTPAHGSNNGHGASTMHVYAGRVAINGDSPAAARPILYATHDGSGNGSGDGGQDGSGQGSGSGNRASQSAVLCGAAQEQRDPRDPAKLGSSDAVGSSAVRAAPAPAAEAADGQQAQPLQQGGPAGPAAGAKQAETAARQAAVAWSAQLHRQQDGPPAAPGFRAWVSPRQPAAAARATVGASLAASGAQASNGARRLSSGCADCQTAPSPSAGAGSAAVPATVGSVAAAPSERFGSGVTVGTGNGTGGSTGTQIAAAGDASTQGGSTAATPRQQQQQQLRLGSQPSLGTATRTGVAAGHSEAQPQGSRALPPLPGLPQPQPPVQQAGGTAQAAQAQAQAQHQQQQQHQQQRAEFMQQRDAAAQWVSAQHGAAAQLHRLQQHHQQHHQIMSSYAGSAAALGALPPHMMPPALNPFGLGLPPPQSLSRDNMPLPYGEHHLMQNGAQRMQAQQQAAAAKQAEMQQQLGAAMMASYPGYMLAPYGMAGFSGMRPPPGWLMPQSAQQAQQLLHHVQSQQQHQQRPPQFAQSAQTPTPPLGREKACAHARPHIGGGGGTMSAPLHGVKAGGPLAGVPPRQAGSLMPRMVNGSSSTLGAPATGSAGTALTTTGPGAVAGEPSRSERRAHALHKYKQKRKNLCFTKKIRYESRKQLAQARPRVKGQFVRMPSGAAEPSEADVILEAAEQPAPMQPGTAAIGIQLVVAAAQAVEVTNGAAPMADVEEDGEYDKDGCEFEEDEDMAEAEAEDATVQVAAPAAAAPPAKAAPSPQVAGGAQRNARAEAQPDRRRNGRNGSDSGSNSPEPDEDGAEA